MRREYRLLPLFEPTKMRGCPSHHAVTFSSLSWLTTHRPFLKGCSTAVRAAGEVFASPGRLPDATSYRAVAAGASTGAQKVCHRRQGSNSCLICPLPCAAHALCGPFRGGRYLYGRRGARQRPRLGHLQARRRCCRRCRRRRRRQRQEKPLQRLSGALPSPAGRLGGCCCRCASLAAPRGGAVAPSGTGLARWSHMATPTPTAAPATHANRSLGRIRYICMFYNRNRATVGAREQTAEILPPKHCVPMYSGPVCTQNGSTRRRPVKAISWPTASPLIV